ncbi:MAG TPA: 30S ribosomal protein S27e [Thermoplasmatales archaeon]|nr:30S ribosomal protein S27e [Thermoplasmata archaeon]HDD57058.1 30S ribosomal protein S27e [Thermoplasmatales archaeon]HEC86559.1 30S ribosomal protein S27e [Thermoplasmatales archaeon]
METRSKFVKVRCEDCGNEQVIFNRASTVVSCHICGATLAEPRGGKAHIRGEIIEEIE